MPDCRIILVEARPVRRQRLAAVLAKEPQFTLVASCANLMEAYTRIEADVPELIAISRRMTDVAEHAMLLALMRILGVGEITFDDDLAEGQLVELLRGRPADLRLVPERRVDKPLRGVGNSGSEPARVGAVAIPELMKRVLRPQRVTAMQPIILIGASTGGVEALHQLLPRFPSTCPPVVVVQHIRGAFSSAFAERLDRICPAEVCEARDGAPLVPGQILVAPGDATHLHISGRHPVQAKLIAAPPVSGHRPSVDALFTSALPLATRVVAALLTGMGADGAQGMLALRQAGARTFAQDRASSTVYGMPRVAAELGAADQILPLSEIAQAILTAAQGLTLPNAANLADTR